MQPGPATAAPLAPLLALALLAAAGCGSTPSARFYVLEALPAAAQAPATGAEAARAAATAGSQAALVVDVGPVILAQGLDRPQMLTRRGPHEVALRDYERWAEPLDGNIARVLAENLAVLTGSESIGQVPDAETQQDGCRVTLHVLRCEAGADGQSLLVVRWRLFAPGAHEPSLTRRSVFAAPLPTPDAAGMAAALSGSLADLAREIAAALPAG
jgi:uncharacterized protein